MNMFIAVHNVLMVNVNVCIYIYMCKGKYVDRLVCTFFLLYCHIRFYCHVFGVFRGARIERLYQW